MVKIMKCEEKRGSEFGKFFPHLDELVPKIRICWGHCWGHYTTNETNYSKYMNNKHTTSETNNSKFY